MKVRTYSRDVFRVVGIDLVQEYPVGYEGRFRLLGWGLLCGFLWGFVSEGVDVGV